MDRATALHDWETLDDDDDVEARLRLIVAAVQTAQAVIKTLHVHDSRAAFEIALATSLRTGRSVTLHRRGAT